MTSSIKKTFQFNVSINISLSISAVCYMCFVLVGKVLKLFG